MPYFVVAEPHGVIRQVSHCDDEVWALLQIMADPFRGGLAVAIPPPPADLTAYQATHYVADGAVVERTEMAPNVSTTSIAADGVAVATIAGLPSGEDTFNWPNAAGKRHDWPAPQFTQFAKLVMQFVYQCAQVAQGHSDTLPSPQLAID